MNNQVKLASGYKIWIGLTILGIVINIGLLTMFGKDWKTVNQQQKQLQELTVRINTQQELENQQQALNSQFLILDNFFVKGESGVAAVAQKLEQAADNLDLLLSLTFEDFPEKTDINGTYQQGLGINATVEGSYQAVSSWVQQIEKLPYFIRFTEIEISPLRLSSGIKAEFSGTIFLKNEQ